MRTRWVAVVLFVALLMTKVSRAQVYQFATPPPQVTATAAPWQVDSAAIVFQGIVYHPTSFVRPFDGNVMVQLGAFDGVPVYGDKTLEPYSILYVPIARGMRQYERAREGELAGTTGSQTPTLPVQPESAVRPEEPAVPVGTTGVVPNSGPEAIRPTGNASTAAPAPSVPRVTPMHVETIPPPRETDGVWIRYNGVKWYSDGEAVPFSPARFTRIGTYRGFPVYHERTNGRDIWVAVVQDGPLAPYARR